MKNRKFLLFAFILLLFATPLFASFQFDDDLPDVPDQEKTKVVFVFGQEKREPAFNDLLKDFTFVNPNQNLNRYDAFIYNDATDIQNQYIVTKPTNKITVKDLARNINPFRFYNQSNRKFIASNLQTDSKRA